MLKAFKPTWLYLKQHNKTGLKYFGKTVRDPKNYHGSGVYWNSHLKKHGYDVTTIWQQLFTTEAELVAFALDYSQKNNIVESVEYANLKPEDGLMGGDTGITEHGRKIISEKSKIHRHTEETKQKLREARAQQACPRTGRKHSLETIEKIKAARKLQKNVRGIISV
jgi:hypothetical protein